MSSDPQTYDDLKASVALWLVRDDLTDRIPEFIALAERRLTRKVYTLEREAETTLTAAAAVDLPSDFGGVRTVYIDTDPKVRPDFVTLGVLRERYADSATGIPAVFAITGGQMVFGPAPDSAYSVPLTYWKDLTPLSDSNTSNWLLVSHSDLYLSATLAEAFLALRDTDAAQIWDARTQAKIDEINAHGRLEQYGGAPVRIRSAVVV